MAYRLLFYIGHFAHDDSFAEADVDGETGLAYPKVKQPLYENELLESAIRFCDGDSIRVENWEFRFNNDHLECSFLSDQKAREWLFYLVQSRNLDAVDGSTLRVIPLSEIASMASIATRD